MTPCYVIRRGRVDGLGASGRNGSEWTDWERADGTGASGRDGSEVSCRPMMYLQMRYEVNGRE